MARRIAAGIPDPGAWRFAAAIALLVSVGFVLLGSAMISSVNTARRQAALLDEQGERIVANEARIAQLAGELTSRGIDLPSPPPPRTSGRPTTTTPPPFPRSTLAPPAPASPPAPPVATTTTTTAPLVCLVGLCLD